MFAVPRQQQQVAGEALPARVEQLVDQVFFDLDVARQHVRDEPVGQRAFVVQEAHHPLLVHEQDAALGGRSCRRHPDRLARQTAFAEELPRAEDRHDGLAAGSGVTERLTSPF